MGVDKPTYTQIPNCLLDDLLPLMKVAELKVTLALSRHTFGYHRDTVEISLSDLQEFTNLSRQGVINGINAGLERGTIERRDGKRGGFVYGLNINDEQLTSQPTRLVNEVDYSTSQLNGLVSDETVSTSQVNGLPLVNEVDQSSQLNGLEVVNLVDLATPTLNKEKETIKENCKEEEREIAADAAPPSFTWPEFLEAFCWVCYGHKELSALTEKQKGMLTSEAKRVLDAKFTLDDLRTWFREKWQTNWKWTKENKHERPLPSDVRSMIPSIRDTEPDHNTNGYHVDIPGVHVLASTEQTTPPLEPLPPIGADNPWATALAEIMPTLTGPAQSWLTGSRLERGEDVEGIPLYRIIVEPRAAAGVEWLTKQTNAVIRRTLGSILRQRIVVEIVAEEMETAP